MNELFLDLETTGTDPGKHGILQIAAIKRRNGREESLDLPVRPFAYDLIDPRALEVNGIKKEEIMDRMPVGVARDAFLSFVGRDNYLIGYNVGFDSRFIRAWLDRCCPPYTYNRLFLWPPIDVAPLAALYLFGQRNGMPNFRLATVAWALGLDVDESRTHNALYDIELTRDIYDIVKPVYR